MKRKIITLLMGVLALAGLALVSPTAAQAHLGNDSICILPQSQPSGDPVLVQFDTGSYYYVYPGTCAGEGTGVHNAEVVRFHVEQGWCAGYNFEQASGTSPTAYINAKNVSGGVWQSTNPGSGYNGSWRTYVARTAC